MSLAAGLHPFPLGKPAALPGPPTWIKGRDEEGWVEAGRKK